MTQRAINGVFSRRLSVILLFQLRVSCVHFFSFSVGLVALGSVVLYWRLLCTGATIAWLTNTVLPMPPPSIVTVIGKTSVTLNSPVLMASRLLHDLVARRAAEDVIICGRSR